MHKILVITIAASAAVMLAEMRYKDNALLTVARALLVGLQGIWFIQIGYIMFRRACCTRMQPHVFMQSSPPDVTSTASWSTARLCSLDKLCS